MRYSKKKKKKKKEKRKNSAYKNRERERETLTCTARVYREPPSKDIFVFPFSFQGKKILFSSSFFYLI
jgi:hypothetical protein